eukprot:Colp12_sorted_trinity150504_noHs@14678
MFSLCVGAAGQAVPRDQGSFRGADEHAITMLRQAPAYAIGRDRCHYVARGKINTQYVVTMLIPTVAMRSHCVAMSSSVVAMPMRFVAMECNCMDVATAVATVQDCVD